MSRESQKDDRGCVVSVIIPVYNTSQYLRKCVETVITQTYKNLEIILVDDGSTDDSYSLCQNIENKHDNVHLIRKENGGLSSARLAGFEASHGEYVLFIDSDDFIEATMVEKLVDAMEKQKAELAICGYFQIDGKTRTSHLMPYKGNVIEGKDNIIRDYILPLTGKKKKAINIPGFLWLRLLKRSLIQKDFFASENTYFAEDHVFDLLYSDALNRIAIVHEPLYNYVIHNQSLTNRYRPGKTRMLQNLYAFYKDFLKAREIPFDEEHRENIISGLIFSSIDNAVLSGSYNGYKREIVLLDQYIAEFREKKHADSHLGRRISLWLLNHRMFRLLYLMRTLRIRSARLAR